MKINLEEFDELIARFREINKAPLDELEIYQDGVRVVIPPKALEDYRFTGLSNRDFLEMRYWESPDDGTGS